MKDKKNKSTEAKTYKFDTLSLHAGYQPHKNAGSRQVPIYQTTSYLFDDSTTYFETKISSFSFSIPIILDPLNVSTSPK